MSCAPRSGRHRGFLAAFVLEHAHRVLARRLLRDEVGELHRIQVFVHLVVQLRPQVVGHAALLVVAVFLAAALRRVEENCHDEQRCMTHDLWAKLNDKMYEYLDSVKLSDLVAQQATRKESVSVLQDKRGKETAVSA